MSGGGDLTLAPDDWLLDRQNRLLREYADRTMGVTYEQLGV